MVVQDDARERQQIALFKLERIEGAGRADTDAKLVVDAIEIPFELKTSTDDSVTTVRDFGPEHVKKWEHKHWLFGFYEKDGVTLKYSLYGSPKMMAPWVKEKEEYIRVDFELAKTVPALIQLDLLHQLLGKKEVYSVEDAKLLHKRQYSAKQYLDQRDLTNGYSPQRMLDILRERCGYVIARGSTLNNPHIPGSYFKGWKPITERHAERLRELVAQALADEAKDLQKAAQAAQESALKIDKAT
jgi:predicted Zn-dependent protease with MMP-like domain